MAKRALLIGCNYPKTEAQLFGCVNDVHRIKALLQDVFDFQEENCTTMVDTNKKSLQPTAKNIRKTLKELVDLTQPGDVLFVHFSGHGLQVRAPLGSTEVDRKDEAIVACDLNLIVDDDLREIVKPLAKGAVLTVVMDCCHSGGLLDHQEVLLPLEDDSQVKLSSLMSLLGLKPNTKEIDTERLGSNKLKNRSYPTDVYMCALEKRVGTKAQGLGVSELVGAAFGEDVTSKFREVVDNGGLLIEEVDQVTQEVQEKGCMATLLGFFGLGPKESSISTRDPGEKSKKKKKKRKEKLGKDVGVLITGCQSNEKSADANISGNRKTAGGAMSNALVNVVRKHHEDNSTESITNSELVVAMRQTLKQAGFKQHPSLEGSVQNADKGFVKGEKK